MTLIGDSFGLDEPITGRLMMVQAAICETLTMNQELEQHSEAENFSDSIGVAIDVGAVAGAIHA